VSSGLAKLLLAGVMAVVTAMLYVPLLLPLLWVMERIPWPGPLFSSLRQLFFLRPRLLPAIATTVAVAIPASLLGLLLGLPAGYGLVQWQRQQKWLGKPLWCPHALFVVARLLPALAVGIPLLEMTRAARPVPPVLVLTLVYAAFGAALATGLGYRLFSCIPQEWEEAAWLLGLSRWRTIRQVVWPLVRREVLAIGGLLVAGMANEVVLASLLLPVRPTVGAVAFRWWPELGIAAASPALLATAGLVFAFPGWLLLALAGRRLMGLWGVRERIESARLPWSCD